MLARLLFIWMFLLSAQVLASAEGMYIHTDGLGSPVARTNQQGQVISRTRYEPYGATAAGATPTIGFTGHVNDPDTGLIYMQQRYYDPYAGRFLSTDPVLTDAATGSFFNRYIYANANPYKYIDPDGRMGIITKAAGEAAAKELIKKAAKEAAEKAAKEAAKKAAKDTAKQTTEKVAKQADSTDKLPDEVFSSKAPKQTTPGTKVLEGQHINDKGRVEPWKAHYDKHGRQIGRTDYNAGNKKAGIPDTHHHKYEYSAGSPGGKEAAHLPGEFVP